MINRACVIGAVIGACVGIVPLVNAYIVAPSMPGPFELIIQLVIVAIPTMVGAILGALVGLIIKKIRNK